MFQSNDDEEREILQKKQRREEDIIVRGNIDPQQATKLLKEQQ